jgi:hypothetical protein
MKLISTFLSSIVLSSVFVGNTVTANENQKFDGILKVGKQYSYIFYLGEVTGDTVVYFFNTNSAVGKRLLSTCKDNRQCSGSGSLKAVDEIPKGIPKPLSGKYKIISIAINPKSQTEVQKNTVCSFINSNNVKIRQKPNLNSPIITTLKRGDGVRATSRDGNWVKIVARDSRKSPNSYTPLEGYISKNYINGCSENQFDRWRK